VLLAVGLSLAWRDRPGTGSREDQASQQTDPTPAQHREGESPTELREAVVGVGSAAASLASRTADATMGPTSVLIPLVASPPMEPLPLPPLENTAGPLAEAGATLSEDLAPVTNSARRALGLFLRELPVARTEPEPGEPGATP
jgi:hypothetical protein